MSVGMVISFGRKGMNMNWEANIFMYIVAIGVNGQRSMNFC